MKTENNEDTKNRDKNLNLIGDCIETVYKTINMSNKHLPINDLKRIIDNKTKPEEFEIVKTIAKGGYGEVFLVRKDKIYAMKRVSKDVILKQPNTALFMAEKALLVDSIGSEWLVSAEMTLQDDDYLYYLMDFIPGGDFMGLLSKEDVLEEEWVRFYVVELVAALDELHKLGWIHRDLKPDNILIGKDGHIKLADFGSSIKMVDGKARSSFVVGTPDYVSPDILESGNLENDYSEDIDFWTLGVIIYEMLFGATPFYSLTLVETYRKITDVSYTFPFKISEDIKDLITKLMCKKDKRIGIKEIKGHVFFKDVDWNNVKGMVPPFIPEINNELDTSNFIDTYFEADNKKLEKINYIDFVGFTFDPKMSDAVEKTIQNSGLSEKDNCVFVKHNEISEKNNGSYEKNNELSEKNNNIINKSNEFSEKDVFVETIEVKKRELKNIEIQIKDVNKQYSDKISEYKNIMSKVISEREEFYSIENELQAKREELDMLDKEIKERKSSLEEYFKNIKITEDNNFKIKFQENSFDFSKLNLHINDIKTQYILCTNQYKNIEVNYNNLKNYIKNLRDENIKFKKMGVDNLKRQLRILTTEVKEYQQKCEQEVFMRKQLEEELKSIKAKKIDTKPISYNHEFVCSLIKDNQKISSIISIVNELFYLNDRSCYIGNVYVQELKNNELYHESYKNRSLILKLIFIKESVKSISSSGRRSLKSLEEDYKVELSMKVGLENMMPLLQGKQLDEARLQYEGTLKKISQLEREIDIARKDTLSQQEVEDPDPIKLYEFNNHLFSTKTFPPGTLCEHCNEVLYGVCDQGFECKDCKMVVHKACYILGNVSCETYNAFKKGDCYYVLMRSIEEKERLLDVYKKY